MKKVVLGLFVIVLAGCAVTPVSRFRSATPGCQSNSSTANELQIKTDFCIGKRMFQPSQYLVVVNDQIVFEGTDYTRVAIEKKIKEGNVTGGCDANVQIQESSTQRALKLEELPKELIAACRITADSNGNSLPFRKDPQCDQVFYNSLAPMIGKVFPVEISRQCNVKLGDQMVFEGNFRF